MEQVIQEVLTMMFLFLYRACRSRRKTFPRGDAGWLREVAVLDDQALQGDPRTAPAALGPQAGGASAVCRAGAVTDGTVRRRQGDRRRLVFHRGRVAGACGRDRQGGPHVQERRDPRDHVVLTWPRPSFRSIGSDGSSGAWCPFSRADSAFIASSSAKTPRRPHSFKRRNRGLRSCPMIQVRGSIASRTTTCSTSYVAKSETSGTSPKSRSTTRSRVPDDMLRLLFVCADPDDPARVTARPRAENTLRFQHRGNRASTVSERRRHQQAIAACARAAP